MKKNKALVYTLLAAGLIITVILSSGIGALYIKPGEIIQIFLSKLGLIKNFEEGSVAENVLLWIRLPRVVMGVLIGAGLAVAGLSMQALFRNPLAEPGLMGITSGASVSAVICIVFLSGQSVSLATNMWGYYTLNIVTFIGACVTTIIIYQFSKSGGKTIVATMLLAGIAVNAICGAITGLIVYTANDQQLRDITFWTMGSLGGASWNTVLALLPFTLLSLVVLPGLAKSLNAYALGENEAGNLGVNTSRMKFTIITIVALTVGSAVAAAGMIGFIGLIVPHMLRLWLGPDNRMLVITSAMAGGILLTLSDMVARTIVMPAELPIGILTAMMGTPMFIWLIAKEKRNFQLF
jgi:iron complex transport system permease protein